jgi:hypothetical protein
MKQVLAFFLGAFVAVAFACSVSGCISTTPTVPVTPQNAQQVAACTSVGNAHNDLVVGDFVLSGAATGLGAVAAADTNQNAQKAFAIAGASTAAVAGIATGITAFTASEFANDNCSVVVNPLPVKPSPTTLIWHLDPPPDWNPRSVHWRLDAPAWNDSQTAGAR